MIIVILNVKIKILINVLSCLESVNNFSKLICFNAQGLLESSHYDQICYYTKDLQADIIAIGETWLKKSIRNSLIKLNEYRLFRSDHNLKSIKRAAAVYVPTFEIDSRSNFLTSQMKCHTHRFFLLEIQSTKKKLLFYNLYRPGDCPDSETDALLHRINE